MIERNTYFSGKKGTDQYKGTVFDFRLIDFLNLFRFTKIEGNKSTIDSTAFIEKIYNKELTHKSIKDKIPIKELMTI